MMIRSIEKTMLVLSMVFLMTGSLLAQPEAKIVGPKQAPAGELVVLSSTGSTGDNLVWVRPDAIQTVQAGCTLLDTQIFFSTTKPGKYEFWLIAADKAAKISYAKHTVEVVGLVQPPPVDPDPGQPPVQPDPARWSKLQETGKSNADKVNDPTTRSRLKSSIAATILAIDAQCQAGQCPTLADAKAMAFKAIESTLLTRTGQSAMTHWETWRKGNQAELDRLGLSDVKDYSSALKAMAAGL
jgi:hypothetical protein